MAGCSSKSRFTKGKECAAFGCSSRSYDLIEGEKVLTSNVFFLFPKEPAVVKDWCNLIKRQNNKDGFKVGKYTCICSKHFLPSDVRKAPGGTRHSLVKGARPVLHAWNDFKVKERKPPTVRTAQTHVTVVTPKTTTIISNADSSPQSDTSNLVVGNLSDPENELSELEKLREELRTVKNQLEEEKQKNETFAEHVMMNDKNINHYTGFPSKQVFDSVYEYLDPGLHGENLVLFNSQNANESENRGRPRILSPLHAFVLTLVRLRRNFDVVHLSYLFKVSEGTVSNTVSTWINFLYIKLGSIPIWPSLQSVKLNMPQSMREKFPNVKCIIDCVEFKVSVPSSLTLHKMMYSDYKSHTTIKVLVGIAPGGGFTFISSSFPGSISDKQITIKSGILNPDLWEPGEQLMADRGFTVAEYLQPLGVSLVIPSFLKGRSQFGEEEVVRSQQIANERIHVERMIQRLKCYHIFDRVIPLNMMGSINQIVTICGILSNFQEPILKKNSQT